MSLIVFGLNYIAEEDRTIAKQENNKVNSSLELSQTQKEVKQNPLFYFQIQSAAIPAVVNQIQDAELANKLEQLAIYSGNKSAINQLVIALFSFYKNSKHSESEKFQLRKNLINLNGDDLQEFLATKKEYSSLLNAHQQIKPVSFSIHTYIPVLSWNGTNNQYHEWLVTFLSGDFGYSISNNQKVSTKILNAIGWTALLSLISITLAFIIAYPTAIFAAKNPTSFISKFLDRLFFALYSIPNFWLATLLIILFASGEYLNWFPAFGYGYYSQELSWINILQLRISHLTLPIFCLTYGSVAFIYQQLKSSIETELQKNYVKTAYSKGLTYYQVIFNQVIKNASFPMVTLLGNLIPAIISGSFVIEYIFAIPGMGKLSIDAFLARDYNVIFFVLLLTSFLSGIGLLVADLIYFQLDPRLSLKNNRL